MKDYYFVLGIGRDSTTDEVKRAYRRNVKRSHPDQNRGAQESEHFLDVHEAYEVLSDPERRESYDRMLEGSDRRVPTSRRSTGPFAAPSGGSHVWPTARAEEGAWSPSEAKFSEPSGRDEPLRRTAEPAASESVRLFRDLLRLQRELTRTLFWDEFEDFL